MNRTLPADSNSVQTDPWEVEQKNQGGVAGYAVIPPYLWKNRFVTGRELMRDEAARNSIERMLQYTSVEFFTMKWHAEKWIREQYESEDSPEYNRVLAKVWREEGWLWGIVPIRFSVVPRAMDRMVQGKR